VVAEKARVAKAECSERVQPMGALSDHKRSLPL